MWLRKKTQDLPTSWTSCRLNPHNQLGRLCVYGIYNKSLRVPTKENALVLRAVDIGGKNTQEENQIRIWASPTAGPEMSTVLEGILGRWVGLWLPVRERTLAAVSEEKHLLFLFFDLFCRFVWIFFLFFSLFSLPLLYLLILLALWNLTKLLSFFHFVLSHIFYCCYKPLLLPFWGGFWFCLFICLFSLFNFNFLNLLLFFVHLFLCLLFLLFFSPCS